MLPYRLSLGHTKLGQRVAGVYQSASSHVSCRASRSVEYHCDRPLPQRPRSLKTVCHGSQRIEALRESDSEVDAVLSELKKQLIEHTEQAQGQNISAMWVPGHRSQLSHPGLEQLAKSRGDTVPNAGAKYGIIKTSWKEHVRSPLKSHPSCSTRLNAQVALELLKPFARDCNSSLPPKPMRSYHDCGAKFVSPARRRT